MAQSIPATYIDATARTARALENTVASFVNGMNDATCQPGIGIAIGQPNAAGTAEQFTLLDQFGEIRVPQDSQSLGGSGFVDRDSVAWPSSGGVAGVGIQPVLTGTNQTQADKDADPDLDGVLVITGDANLQTLLAGWVDTAV